MGRRGPAKTPSNVIELKGNPGKRAINKREWKPGAGSIECPLWVDAEGKKEWARMAPSLIKAGLLTEADINAFGIYCNLISKYIGVAKHIKAKGRYSQGRRAPWAADLDDAEHTFLKYSQRFGFTPADRAGIEMPAKGEEDDFARDMA